MGAVREGDSVTRPARDSTPPAGSSSRHDKPSSSSLRRLIQRFPQASVLVIGDLILDHYIWGRVSRISPEAPVPVVHVESESMRLGGAANVFNNVLALGAKADVCGMIGSDEAGRQLLKELGLKHAGRGGVVTDADRPTIKKSRVIAHNQQVVRYDVERKGELKPQLQRKILRYVESRLREVTCLVVSDYAKGVVTAGLATDPSARPATASDMLAALSAARTSAARGAPTAGARRAYWAERLPPRWRSSWSAVWSRTRGRFARRCFNARSSRSPPGPASC